MAKKKKGEGKGGNLLYGYRMYVRMFVCMEETKQMKDYDE
jgi:hypothetical protein